MKITDTLFWVFGYFIFAVWFLFNKPIVLISITDNFEKHIFSAEELKEMIFKITENTE